MRLESTIIISEVSPAFFGALAAETECALRNDRCTTMMRRNGGQVIITIKAFDATAYRAAVNSVAKLLITFESMKGIDDGT